MTFLLLLLLQDMLSGQAARPVPPSDGAYRQALPGYRYQFPLDHFSHPNYRTEWWYYTGNLRARDGRQYGFELVFFRQGEPHEASGSVSANPSAWRADDVYFANLALTDINGRRFRYFQRYNRAGPGIAGASFEDGRIWNGNWQALWDKTSGAQTISAVEEGIRFNLHLTPAKAPVIHGENGVSQKSAALGQASYYVSFPRLTVQGELNGAEVAGIAWMDHEWFSNMLAPSDQGWDWFSIQLDNRSELMLFQLRNKDSRIPSFDSGTYIAPDGHAANLKRGDFILQPVEYWTSPKTGARYPIHWRIAVPSLKIQLECSAAIPDQELAFEDQTGTTYWEGAVRYSGSTAGVGYLEMTGYAGPVRLN